MDEPVSRAKGGLARAAALTAERRSEIARKGGMARKGTKNVMRLTSPKDMSLAEAVELAKKHAGTQLVPDWAVAAIIEASKAGR